MRTDFPGLTSLELTDVMLNSRKAVTSPLASAAGLTSLALRLVAHNSKRLQTLQTTGTALTSLQLVLLVHDDDTAQTVVGADRQARPAFTAQPALTAACHVMRLPCLDANAECHTAVLHVQAAIAQLPALTELRLGGHHRCAENHMTPLSQLTQLRSLTVSLYHPCGLLFWLV